MVFTCSFDFNRHNAQLHSKLHDNEMLLIKAESKSKVLPDSSKLENIKVLYSFPCNECDEKFTDSGDLTRHKLLHNKKSPPLCNVCQQTFSGASSLRRHKRVHLKRIYFAWDKCDKSFTSSSYLERHYKRSHLSFACY